MYRLRRLRLENIGHRSAGFKSLILDLTGGPHVLDGRRLSPVDTILWLRNGGGKSSLLSLFFSLLLPAKRDFIGHGKTKSLADYVPDGQVSHVIAEWQDAERPATGAALVTGGVYQWRDGQQPADVGDRWERLERRWYLLRPQPGALELDSLPVRTEDGQLSLNAYVRQLEMAHKQQRRLQLVVAVEQHEWEEQLHNHGLDPQIFKIQRTMNQEEGGITDLFTFSTPEAFVDFLIDMITDVSGPAAARAAMAEHADKLAARPARELEQRFLAEAILRLRPVQKSAADLVAADRALHGQTQLAHRTAHHLLARAEWQQQESSLLRDRAETAAREADQADARVAQRQRHVAAISEAAARLQVRDRAATCEQCRTAADTAQQEHEAWQAVGWVLQLAHQESERQQANQLLSRLQAEQIPLREAMEQAGAALHAKLDDALGALEPEIAAARCGLRSAQAQLEAAEREHEEAAAAAVRASTEATWCEARRSEGQAAIAAARRQGVLGEQETPQEAVQRLTRAQEVAQEEVTQARCQLLAAQEHSTTVAAQRVQCASRLTAARQEHGQVGDRWSVLAQERRELAGEPRLTQLAGLDSEATALDLDEVGGDLVAMLHDQAARSEAELTAERAQALEDQRLRAALEQDGFCPPPREVEQAVTALRARGADAVAGAQFLRDTVPAHRHDAVMAAIPQLIGGVVICGPVPGGDLAALARQADVSLPTVIAVGRDDQARALLSRPPADIAVLPVRPSVLNADAGEEELARVGARLDTLDERLGVLSARREADLGLAARLTAHLEAFGPLARTVLEESLRRLDGEVDALTEQAAGLERQAAQADESGRWAQQRLDKATAALLACTQQLPQADALVKAADAVEHWEAQAQRARAQAHQHRRDAQRIKAVRAGAQRQVADSERALRQCEERARRWGCEREALGLEVPAEILEGARALGVPDAGLDSLRRSWEQARRDWHAGISDATLQHRLAAAEANITALNQQLEKAGPAACTRAAELARKPQASDPEALAALVAGADRRREDAQRAAMEADVLHRQAVAAHQTAADELAASHPDAPRLDFATAEQARTELDSEKALLVRDQGLVHARRLDASTILRSADQAANDARRLQQSAASLSSAAEHHLPVQNGDAPQQPDAIDALLLERYGLSASTARALQPDDAERITQALVGEVQKSARAHESAKNALRRHLQQVERLALDARYAPVVDGRLRERMQHDPQVPSRLATLLEDIEAREQQVIAVLAESAEDQARVVDVCAGMVEAVLDSVEEVARHSRLPQNLGSWSGQRFLSLEMRQRARGDELTRRLSAEVDRLIASLPATAEGKASALPKSMVLAKRLVLAALGGHGNVTAKIIKPAQNLDTLERESVTVIQKFSGGEKLTVSVLLYCTLARLRATQRDRRIPGGVGTLILDNPFGKANYGPFIDLQRHVAGAHNIQLVYTTGSNDRPALGRFPLVIRMRNSTDARTRRRYIQILERYGSAVAAGVTHTQSEGITSAHLLRRQVLAPPPDADGQACEKETA
ncbi:hypothetical protein ABZ918_10495 [Streptomyces viridosporus]|uniref:hypothetical protein n=1 Tax=Streptomyces viridosporus TaxID=67581 RepID=UPI00343CB1C1